LKKKRKKQQVKQFKRHTNWHHVYPTSRFKLKKDPVLHTAWHDVFQNNTPEEAIERVEEWIANPEKFKEEITENERKLNAWELLFVNLDSPSDETIGTIKASWTFQGVRMIKIRGT